MASKRKKKEKRREKRLTQKQVQANQENARLSTGPNTEAGKAKSSRNATTFNFYGQKTPVAPWENPEDYEAFKGAFLEELAPQGPRETWFAHRVIAESWRLLRVPQVEVMLYEMFADDPDRLFYELNKLSLNEQRMERLRAKAQAQLDALQAERLAGQQQQSPPCPEERRNPSSVGAALRGAGRHTLIKPSYPASQAGFDPSAEAQMGSFREPPHPPADEPGQPALTDAMEEAS